MNSQIRRDIRDMLDRIIMAGGRKKRAKSSKGGIYDLEGDGLRAFGLMAGKKRKATRKKATTVRRRTAGVARRVVATRARSKIGGRKKVSPWISHVKKYAKAHGMNYSEALKSPGVKRGYKSVGSGGVRKRSVRKRSVRKRATVKKKTYMTRY